MYDLSYHAYIIMLWIGVFILSVSILLLHTSFLTSNAFIIQNDFIAAENCMNYGRKSIVTNPLFRFECTPKADDDRIHSEEEDDDDDTIIAYNNRSLLWTMRYRELLPYEYARRRVLSLGLQSKADWDEYVSDGKRGNGMI